MAITAVKLLPNGVISKASILDPIVDDLTSLDSRASALEGGTFQAVPLSNGWTAGATTPSIRKRGPNDVQFVGTFNPGTKVGGTLIGTLPVGFRPAHDMDLIVSVNATVSGGQSPHFQLVATTGAINCWGCDSATSVGINIIFPTNL